LTLVQIANGGAGGDSSTTAGGQGGQAFSAFGFDDLTFNTIHASSLTGTATANGGAGGDSTGTAGLEGGGGSAGIALTGATVVTANADASGGTGGSGATAGQGGTATANATGTATGTGLTGTATTNAVATAGAAGVAPGTPLPTAQGTATAQAAASTAAGQQATATSAATGWSAQALTTANTSGAGLVTAVAATTDANGTGLLTASSTASIGGATPGFSGSAVSDYAFALGFPPNPAALSPLIADTLAANPAIDARLGGANAMFFGYGTQGATATNAATGPETLTSTEQFTVSGAAADGDLIVGLVGNTSFGTGFRSLTFTVAVGATQVENQQFDTLASAQAFFGDNALDLGAIPATDGLQVSLGLTLVTSTGGDGFAESFLLGDEAPCFAAGTRIATERGEVAVEALSVGDTVRVLLCGGPQGSGISEVIWVGRREVDCARHPHPRKVWPVRIAAGAFGPNRPHTDLFLSPDHAIYIEDVLIPIKHLINGSTIVQVPVRHVTYHHIELAQHDVLLAEGLPAESFLDMRDGSNYANRPGPTRLYPDFSARMWEAFGCARLVVTGPEFLAARTTVADFATERKAA
jgi:hypothetical protein